MSVQFPAHATIMALAGVIDQAAAIHSSNEPFAVCLTLTRTTACLRPCKGAKLRPPNPRPRK